MDGVRRWFQRKGSSFAPSLTSTSDTHENYLTPFEQNQYSNKRGKQETFTIEVDFDLSGLKAIKVPKRISFPLSSSSPSMDPHKKVKVLPSFLVDLFVVFDAKEQMGSVESFYFYNCLMWFV